VVCRRVELAATTSAAIVTFGVLSYRHNAQLRAENRRTEAKAAADKALERLESYVRIEPNDQFARDLSLKLHGNRFR
jgi:hypothetical protein